MTLTAEEERELAARIKVGDRAARDALVARNIALVHETVRRIGRARGDVSHDDLVAEGMVGLVEAVDRFDPDKGRFSTVAVLWIRNRMLAAMYDQAGPVRLQRRRSTRTAWWRIGRVLRDLAHRGLEATPAAIAERLGVELEDVEAVLAHRGRTHLRLDAPARSGGRPAELADESDGAETALAEQDAAEHGREALRRALEVLDPRQRRIVEVMKLSDHPPRLADLGKELGLSGERVRQIELEALELLRSVLERDDGEVRVRPARLRQGAR